MILLCCCKDYTFILILGHHFGPHLDCFENNVKRTFDKKRSILTPFSKSLVIHVTIITKHNYMNNMVIVSGG